MDRVILALMDHVYNPAKVSADHVRTAANEWNIAQLNKVVNVDALPVDLKKIQYEEYVATKMELKRKWLKSKNSADLLEWLQFAIPPTLLAA